VACRSYDRTVPARSSDERARTDRLAHRAGPLPPHAFDAPGFRADAVAPAVRSFYERTQDFDLHVRPDWSRGWLLAYRLFRLCDSRFVTLHYRLQRRREQPGAAPRQPA
jgi:hypothetical protein